MNATSTHDEELIGPGASGDVPGSLIRVLAPPEVASALEARLQRLNTLLHARRVEPVRLVDRNMRLLRCVLASDSLGRLAWRVAPSGASKAASLTALHSAVEIGLARPVCLRQVQLRSLPRLERSLLTRRGAACVLDAGLEPLAAGVAATLEFERMPVSISALTWAAAVLCVVAHEGFTGVERAGVTAHMSTVDQAIELLSLRRRFVSERVHADFAGGLVGWTARARGMLERLREHPARGGTGIVAQSCALLDGDELDLKRRDALDAFARAIQWLDRQRLERLRGHDSRACGSHVGRPGQRFSGVLTLVAKTAFVSEFGEGFVFRFVDRDGHALKWTTSAAPAALACATGRQFQASFRVKTHGLYEGQAITDIGNFTLESWVSDSALLV